MCNGRILWLCFITTNEQIGVIGLHCFFLFLFFIFFLKIDTRDREVG